MKKVLIVLGLLMMVFLVPSFASAYDGGGIAIEGKVSRSVYFSPVAATNMQPEYCVYVFIKNTGTSPITIDLIEVFVGAGENGLTITSEAGEEGWNLPPEDTEPFEFCTDGYTSDILRDARESNASNISFDIVIHSDRGRVGYTATIPPLEDLPVEGYTLEFKRL